MSFIFSYFHRAKSSLVAFLLTASLFPVLTCAEECASDWTHILRYYPGTQAFFGVTHNGSKFVTVGHACPSWTSTDGVNWTQGTQSLGGPLYEVIYAQGKFVAVGWQARILTSTDGLNWTERVSNVPEPVELFALVYDPDTPQFVAAGANGNGATSPDGITWTGFDAGNMAFRSITYHDGLYVGCGSYSVHKSTNGRNWTSNAISGAYLFSSAYANGMHLVAGGEIHTSTDNGVNWTQQTIPEGLTYLWDTTWTGTHFVIAGQKEGTDLDYCPILTSPNGTDWTLRNSQATSCAWLWGITSMDTGSGSILVSTGHVGNIVRSECAFEPFITVQPVNESPCNGQAAQFCVMAVGELPLSYQWSKNPGGGWTDITGAQSDCYSIGSVSTADTGDYRCRVWNSYGTITSETATLAVRFAPSSFSEQPESQNICEFATAQLCVTPADGSPVLSYQWERDVGSGWVNAPNGSMSCLTINSVDPVADDGDYRCRVWNECGTATSTEFTLTVIERAKADFDCDLDVDQDDFGHFQSCLTNSGELQTNLACMDAKLDGDNDVDADDFAKFLNCLSGPGITAVFSCAD